MKDRQSEDMHVGLLNEEARWSCRIYTHSLTHSLRQIGVSFLFVSFVQRWEIVGR